MAAPKFYRKAGIDPVILSTGQRVALKSPDYKNSFLATDNAFIQSEFDALIAQNQFGLSEISFAEYDEAYLKKKPATPLGKFWREEMTAQGIRVNPLAQSLVAEAKAAAAADTPPIPVTMEDMPPGMTPAQPTNAPTPPEAFQPRVGRRL